MKADRPKQLGPRLIALVPPKVLSAVTCMAVAAVLAGCEEKKAAAPPPPPKVTVAKPQVTPVTNYIEFTGNTAATNTVKLVARVEGYLTQNHFKDGAPVKKGSLLISIQDDQYKAQLQKAQSQLMAAQAALKHAETEFKRYSDLNRQRAAAQVDVDRWQYERDKSRADVLGARAQVAIAELNLSYTQIKAPFDGRMGTHLVDPGNVVGSMGQETELAEINQIDPIYVYFTINERDLLRILAGQKMDGTPVVDRYIPLQFSLLNEDTYPHRGRLDFASISASPTSGTLTLRGIFPNPKGNILPGLFTRVRAPLGKPADALVVPGDAISFDQQGRYVLVVGADDIVERKGIKTGAQTGRDLVVTEGLTRNDWVIVDGILQAIPGRKVDPQQAKKSGPSSAEAVTTGGGG
jgi:RND family efflux transporter MFP subunit